MSTRRVVSHGGTREACAIPKAGCAKSKRAERRTDSLIDLSLIHIFGRGGAAHAAHARLCASDLGLGGDLEVAVPWSTGCFATSGATGEYFHGGGSPQELVVPVLVVESTFTSAVPIGTGSWTLTPSRPKLSSLVATIIVGGEADGLFTDPVRRVRIEVRDGRKVIGRPTAAAYGFDAATGELAPVSYTHLPARFARFYPYPPHFLGLSIEAVNNLRLQDRAGNNTTAGGSNRTLIRQAYAMLTAAPRDGGPAMKDLPVGRMVTLDRVCDVLWSNLSSEQKADIEAVKERFPTSPWATRVAKVLCLLHQVRDLPRTEANLAATLWDGLDQP